MERSATLPLLLKLALLLLIPATASAQTTARPTPAARAETEVRFSPNMGQILDVTGRPRPDIRYVSRTSGMAIHLAEDRISYVFRRLEGDLEHHRHADGFYDEEHPEPIEKLYRMDLEFIGASKSPEISSDMPGGSYTNYYLPHLTDGLTHVPSFGRITYRNLYPNIDFVIRSMGSALKYDFIVRPGGRISDIRMRYVGATSGAIDSEGRLVTTTPLGSLSEDAPYTFQQTGTLDDGTPVSRSIASRYRIVDGVISFIVGEYDPARTLVIDPTQKWSTYYGGNGDEDMNGGDVTEVDRSGNSLFTGNTTSSSFPTSPGAFSRTVTGNTDIIVVKMNSAGAMLWATIYGGSSADLAHGIVTDKDRNVFVAGHTYSNNFPTVNAHDNSFNGGNGNRDAFAIKFDAAGVRQWGTYYGGSEFDDSYGFAIDSSGNPAMIGTTSSRSGIATPGSFQTTYNSGNDDVKYDGFLVKFNGAGVRQWGTYVGGAETEYGYGAATDIDDNINITGWTNSSNFPVTPGTFQTTRGGDYDAFVMRFNSAGTRLWGTFFGGSDRENDLPGSEIGYAAIATDGDGNPIITGMTAGSLPTSAGAIQSSFGGGTYDAFVAKFDARGIRIWSTYLGGSRNDYGQGVASNATNGVLVTGHTFSSNFPGITADAFQSTLSGSGSSSDAFIVKLNSAGTIRQWVTYYGGRGNDEGVGISFDPFGSIVIAGLCEDDFPVTTGAEQTTYGGGEADAFLALFCDIESGVIEVQGATTFCKGGQVTLFVPPGYTSYLWQNGTNQSISTANQITVSDSGDYWVRLTNGAGCIAYTDTIRVRIHPEPEPLTVPTGTAGLCPNDSLLINAPAGYISYQWKRNGADIPGSTSDTLHVSAPGVYSVAVVDPNGCPGESKSVQVTVVPPADTPTISAAAAMMTSSEAVTYQWSRDGVPVPDATSRDFTAPAPGLYTVTITDINGCRATSEPFDPVNPASATVGFLEYTGAPGERVTIPLTLRSSANLLWNQVTSFTARIRFNRTMLMPEGNLLSSIIDGDDRVITITGEMPAEITGENMSIALIDFTVALGNASSTPLVVEEFEWGQTSGIWSGIGPVTTTTFDGLFTASGLCASGGFRLVDASGATALKPARPNPATGITSIEYEVVEDGRIRLLLVDMYGATIPIVDAEIEHGRYVATFDASRLPPGVYVCVLQTPTERVTRSVAIRR